MGSFFCDLLSFKHEVAIYDTDPQRLRFTFNAQRFASLDEIDAFDPNLVINAATVKYTIDAFNKVLPHLSQNCILSDIASVKTGLPEFYAQCGHPFVSTHPMFGPTFASLSNLSSENAIIITEGDHLGKVFFKDLYNELIAATSLKGNRSDPTPKLNLHEVRETNMPAVLLELGFMDSSTDVPVILTEKFADQCAAAIVKVLVRRGNLTAKPVVPAEHEKQYIYRVQVGAYSKRAGAETMLNQLRDAGFGGIIVKSEK